MQINFDTTTANLDELTALIALCASLGGRLPDHATLTVGSVTASGPADRILGAAPTTIGNVVVKLTADTSELDEAIERTRAVAELGVALIGPEDDIPAPPASAEGNGATTPSAPANEPAEGAATSAPTGSIELDADGIPWDARIHAGTKSQTKGKTWTKLRNVDEVLYGKVHAELQEQYASTDLAVAEGNVEEVPAPPPTSAESAPTADMDVPPPPAPDASGGFKEFAELVAAVAPFNIPYVKLAELARMVSDKKAEKFPDLRTMPEFWDDFYALAQSEG